MRSEERAEDEEPWAMICAIEPGIKPETGSTKSASSPLADRMC